MEFDPSREVQLRLTHVNPEYSRAIAATISYILGFCR